MTELTLAKARRRARWPLAVHEAGHGVVALRLRINVTSATIEPHGKYNGHVQHEPAAARADMLMTLAGPTAERLLDPDGAQFATLLGNEEASSLDDLAEYAEAIGIELGDDDEERRLQLNDLYKELANEVRGASPGKLVGNRGGRFGTDPAWCFDRAAGRDARVRDLTGYGDIGSIAAANRHPCSRLVMAYASR